MANGLIWIPKRLVELGLLNVAAQLPQKFVEYCEQDYAARVQQAAVQVKTSPGKPRVPGERRISSESARYATACLDRSS